MSIDLDENLYDKANCIKIRKWINASLALSTTPWVILLGMLAQDSYLFHTKNRHWKHIWKIWDSVYILLKNVVII